MSSCGGCRVRKFNHSLFVGEDYFFDLFFLDSERNPIDLTGFEFICEFYSPDNTVQCVASVIEVNYQLARVSFFLPRVESLKLEDSVRCSVRVIGGTGYTQFAIDGKVFLKRAGVLAESNA
jgi:hypothetical protein